MKPQYHSPRRRRGRETVGPLEGPRLMGTCSACGGRHRFPDLRWRCTVCGRISCNLWAGSALGCTQCGGKVEAE